MSRWLLFLLAVLSLAGNWRKVDDLARRSFSDFRSWRGRAYCGNGEHTDAYRQIAEENLPKGIDLYFCTEHAGRLDPVDRSTHIALSWERCPVPVRFGDSSGIGHASAIVTSRFHRGQFIGYALFAENDSAALWVREDVLHEIFGTTCRGATISLWQEARGVASVCLVVAAAVCLIMRASLKPSLVSCLLSAGFLLIVGCFTLSHTYFAPTGLGVYGGKAKLLYESGCVPVGFFTDYAYSSYQPAYPPLFAVLSLLGYAAAGGCGEWMSQLSVAFMAGVLFFVVLAVGKAGLGEVLLTAAFFFSGVSLEMSSLYYAEPLMALLAFIGYEKIRGNVRCWNGWLLLGACGLVKTEGLIVFAALSTSIVLSVVFRGGECRRHGLLPIVLRIAGSAAMPAAWHVFAHAMGARFYGYAPFYCVDLGLFASALAHLLRCAFLEPWTYAFVYPLAIAVVVFMRVRRRPAIELELLLLACGLCAIGFALVYSLSAAADFRWLIDTSAARLLWLPAVLLLGAIVRCRTDRNAQ